MKRLQWADHAVRMDDSGNIRKVIGGRFGERITPGKAYRKMGACC
jgi:hypothetical protein